MDLAVSVFSKMPKQTYLLHGCFMKFVEVQRVYTFFCTKYQVLICKHEQKNSSNTDLRKEGVILLFFS